MESYTFSIKKPTLFCYQTKNADHCVYDSSYSHVSYNGALLSIIDIPAFEKSSDCQYVIGAKTKTRETNANAEKRNLKHSALIPLRFNKLPICTSFLNNKQDDDGLNEAEPVANGGLSSN